MEQQLWLHYTAIVEEYDPSLDEWVQKASMLAPRASFGIEVVNDQIHVIGGTNNKAEKYKPSSNNWKTVTQIPTPRHWLAVAVADNKIYAIGGINESSYTICRTHEFPPDYIEVYNSLMDNLSIKSNLLPTHRGCLGFVFSIMIYKLLVAEVGTPCWV